ncbi:5-oxoprolinase subunit PxpB [Hyphococcus flavus]|uniref:5-oxoprolinase subunit PxpB n=1 Tax=Hyphococcus flavus TaxID=1866326 RepID=A0AAE9ZDX5_9PROT|nr:5-oxoprolinase subunit PxpB [Hyphococcus flavus]WDI33049.1 5-oxoprolinase subunit PxpB [Hyphococcus flavus]
MNRRISYNLTEFGEHGWLAQVKSANDLVAAALFVNAVAGALRHLPGINDAVAGVDSVVLRFDPAVMAASAARKCFEDTLNNTSLTLTPPQRRIDIPVCYGGEYGPDLESLSKRLSFTNDDIIKKHASASYRVLTIGFAPGFMYLGPLDPALHVERLETPRVRVPAGSVGIAGAMTGVYSLSSPGGWRIIGRTPRKLFNPDNDDPFTFSPGDEIRFSPIDEDRFHAMEQGEQ